MTPKQYTFVKNARIVGIVLGIGYVIFMAGAFFNGFKPDFTDYVIFVIVVLNVVNAIMNKPIPPSQNPQN